MSLLNNMLGGAGIGAAQGLVGSGSMQGMTLEELQHQQIANQYQQALSQSMLATKQAVASGAYAKQAKPFNPNEEAAYTTPLSQLVTLWQAKFGDTWVEVFDEEFWNCARVRLHNNDKLECVSGWFRIKEDA